MVVLMEKCPECGKEYAKNEIRLDETKSVMENLRNGTINWKNALKIDIVSILIIISVVLIITGLSMMPGQMTKALGDPCGYAEDLGCYPSFGQQYQKPIYNISGLSIENKTKS